MSVVFLSPHPDDAELFCGGTIALLASRARVHLVDLTRGELSSNGTVEGRKAEAAVAARALGLDGRRQLGLPDAGLLADDPDQLEAIVAGLRELSARVVFAPWRDDRHPDHVGAAGLARRAVARLAAERGDSGPRLLHYPCHHGVAPTLLVDVSDWIDRWEAAVRAYASQFVSAGGAVPTPINAPDFLGRHRRRRELWGVEAGCAFAEGFVFEGPWRTGAGDILGE